MQLEEAIRVLLAGQCEMNKERAMMKLKVKTLTNLTQTQRESLQRFGCEATPYISRSHELIFAATCEDWQEQELQKLSYVTSVEPMPTYRAC